MHLHVIESLINTVYLTLGIIKVLASYLFCTRVASAIARERAGRGRGEGRGKGGGGIA